MWGLTQAQQEVVERVDRLTKEKIAPRAAQYDAAATNPVESWRDCWREGILGVAIPKEYGGLGLDIPTYIAVIRTIAKGCASTGMTVHMHSTVMRFINALGTDVQKKRYFDEVVNQGKIFGSWGSEPAISFSRTLLMETVIRGDGDDYVIDGVKYFCTMALGASYYMIWCALDGDPAMDKSLLQALVPADSPGVATDGKWDTLGMRATYSPAVTLKGVRVPRDALLGEPGSAIRIGVIETFALGYAAIYLGIAESALEYAMDYAKKRVLRPENLPVAHDVTVQRHIGEMSAELEAVRLVVADAAASWESADPPGRGLLANRAKYIATQAGLQVTSQVIQVMGGRGAYRELPAERAFRDLRTCTLMPPTVDRMLEAIGKSALGLESGMFRIGTGPQGA